VTLCEAVQRGLASPAYDGGRCALASHLLCLDLAPMLCTAQLRCLLH